jgi:hypothetical protein
MRVIPIDSVSSFVRHIEEHSKAWFYRGQAQDWPLIPSIGRVGRGGFDELLAFEGMILSEFRCRSSDLI